MKLNESFKLIWYEIVDLPIKIEVTNTEQSILMDFLIHDLCDLANIFEVLGNTEITDVQAGNCFTTISVVY